VTERADRRLKQRDDWLPLLLLAAAQVLRKQTLIRNTGILFRTVVVFELAHANIVEYDKVYTVQYLHSALFSVVYNSQDKKEKVNVGVFREKNVPTM
jgi:hypothetical protein